MSTKLIFELLSKNVEKKRDFDLDFPNLQPEGLEIIAENISDVVYETLKQKSIASGEKRKTILEFVHSLCSIREPHKYEDSYKVYIDNFKSNFIEKDASGIDDFIEKGSVEITKLKNDFSGRMLKFHKKKNAKQRERVKQLEFSKKWKEEILKSKENIPLKMGLNCYETKEELIENLLGENINEENDSSNKVNYDFREKQIKMCYGVINLNSIENICVINTVLRKLSSYDSLQSFEVNFLKYLFCLNDASFDFADTIVEDFFFILEKIILKYSTEIIRLTDDTEICNYFLKLEENATLLKIRSKCGGNKRFCCKMKSMLHCLYYYSYCNRNMLRFCNFFE